MYKLAIVGSRRFNDYSLLKEILDPYLGKILYIISGGAMGADNLARRYAKDTGLPIKIYYPDWKNHGKAAGVIRNTFIVKECDKMIAFAYPDSKGTRDSIKKAERKGINVVVIELEEADRQ